MRINVAHLVFETFCDTNYLVVEDSLDSSEGSDVLARAMMQLDIYCVLVGSGETDRKM